MEDGWKYSLDGVEHGPVPLQEILRLLTAGAIGLRTMVSWTKSPEWTPLSAVEIIREQVLAALKARSAAPAGGAGSTQANPTAGGKTQANPAAAAKTQANPAAAAKTQSNPAAAKTQSSPAAAGKTQSNPAAAAKTQSNAAAPAKTQTGKPDPAATGKEGAAGAGRKPAGAAKAEEQGALVAAGGPSRLGRRLAADLVDAIIVGGTLFLLSLGFQAWVGFSDADGVRRSALAGSAAFALVFAWLYCAVLESSPQQGTLGKIALELKVSDLQGRRLSFLRASLRFAARLVSAVTLGGGLVLALFTRHRQTLHDLLAGSVVR